MKKGIALLITFACYLLFQNCSIDFSHEPEVFNLECISDTVSVFPFYNSTFSDSLLYGNESVFTGKSKIVFSDDSTFTLEIDILCSKMENIVLCSSLNSNSDTTRIALEGVWSYSQYLRSGSQSCMDYCLSIVNYKILSGNIMFEALEKSGSGNLPDQFNGKYLISCEVEGPYYEPYMGRKIAFISLELPIFEIEVLNISFSVVY